MLDEQLLQRFDQRCDHRRMQHDIDLVEKEKSRAPPAEPLVERSKAQGHEDLLAGDNDSGSYWAPVVLLVISVLKLKRS